ncbi:hypothetical protein [Chryseobacterium nepalense]|uniref:hypothetical protein n=2 Tax=Chryseobacterium TaxID=59732 RepID=UPI002E0A1811|nr:hypothetical protein [Chryseobacterium nepalense]
MKTSTAFFFCFFYIFTFSQRHLTDVLIVKENNDSLRVKVDIPMIKESSRVNIDEDSFFRKVKVVDDNGKKLYTVQPQDIKELSFSDLDGKKKIYHKEISRNRLMQLLYDGNIKLYKQFIPQMHYTAIYYLFLDSKREPIKVGLFENNEKILLRITESKPELINKIKELKGGEDAMIEILKEFEES